jgi:hypothetical protein
MFNLMTAEAILTFVLTLLALILMKDKPDIAPRYLWHIIWVAWLRKCLSKTQ